MHNNIHPLVFINECCSVQVEVGDFLDCLVFNKELQAGFNELERPEYDAYEWSDRSNDVHDDKTVSIVCYS